MKSLQSISLLALSFFCLVTLLFIASCSNDDDPIAPTVPQGPTSLNASEITEETIELRWTDNAMDETGFYLERKQNGQNDFVRVANLPSGATSHLDLGLAASTTYEYRVFAFNEVGSSESSNVVRVKTLERSITEELQAM